MNSTTTTPALLTSAQLAQRWGIHPGTLANQRLAGTGIAYIKLGSNVRYRLADVEAHERASIVNPVK